MGKANEDGQKDNPLLVSLHPAFVGKAPLWYYILAESQQPFKNNDTPLTLGPVGGRIVGEVLIGLILGDKHSYLSLEPDWTPFNDFLKKGKFGIAEFISEAIKG